jgi:MFS superfamily sulfate permease-like transporter
MIHLLIRGFGAGSMHVVCGFLVATGILYLWDRVWLQLAGTMGLMSVAITYHGVYNILVSQSGTPAMIGYFFPVLTIVISLIFRRRIFPQLQ